MRQVRDMSDSVVIELKFLQCSAVVQSFYPLDQVLTQSQVPQLSTLFEALDLRDTETHSILNFLIICIDWAFLGSQGSVLDWLRLFLCILNVLCCFPRIIINDIAVFVDLL